MKRKRVEKRYQQEGQV